MTIKNWRASAVTCIAVSALLLSGCSEDSGDSAASENPTSESDDGGSSGVVNDAGVEVNDLDDAVATQTVTKAGSDVEIELSVFPIEVRGDVQIVRVGVTPTSNLSNRNGTESLFGLFGNNGFRPQLIDRENLKVYSVLTDAPKQWAIDPVAAKAARGETIIAWAIYAAPEDDVDVFDVMIQDGWPAFTDVPVER